MALLRVSSAGCSCLNDPLAFMDDQTLAQHIMHRRPLDAYTLAVDSALPLPAPIDMTFKANRKQGSGGLAKVSAAHPLLTGIWPEGVLEETRVLESVSADRSFSVSSVLDAWGLQGHA
eukprot:404290-Alexandrium_andersonii.AAC.1